MLARRHEIVRSGLAANDGDEIGTTGDGFFAGVFSSPRGSLAAAIEIQRSLDTHIWPLGERVRVRMGLHTGEAAKEAVGPVGLDVHRAARIAAVGHGGQILVLSVDGPADRPRLTSRRRTAPRSRASPAEGPRRARTDLSARGRRPTKGLSPASIARQSRVAEQPPELAERIRRPRR